MRITIDLPDTLYRRAKAEAALRGLRFRDLIEEGLRQVLAGREANSPAHPAPPPSVHDLMRDCCGIATGAPADYASNSHYLEDFGR